MIDKGVMSCQYFYQGQPVLLLLDMIQGQGKALTERVKTIATRMLKSRYPIMLDVVVGMAVNASPAFANDLGLMLSTEKGTFGMTPS